LGQLSGCVHLFNFLQSQHNGYFSESDLIMTPKRLRSDMPASYRIQVQGILAKSWSDRLGGVAITTTGQTSEAPVTTLSGRLRDQAALCGVLNTLHDLRLPLLSVECEDWDDREMSGYVSKAA